MGDVFDAMNRARKERGEPELPPEQGVGLNQGVAPEPNEPERPGLPIDDVGAAPIPHDPPPAGTSIAAPPVVSRGVSGVIQKHKADEDARLTENRSTGGIPHRDPSLNGYSAEVVVHHDRGSAITEQYRQIRTQILARARHRRVQTHVVTSSAPEEGKSVSTINLGVAFAELRDQKTVLVECDLRRPSFSRVFDRDPKPGLLQLLRGEIDDIDECLHKTVYDNLQFIPAGGRDAAHSTELLSSPRMVQIIDRLRDRYNHIFVDTPPVITVTDACIMGTPPLGDQVMLVVRLHRTPSDVVDRAKRLLKAANCEIAGVILTHMKQDMSKYLYRYGYGART